MKLSIVTPVFRPDAEFFADCAESVASTVERLAGICEVEWVIECDGGAPGIDVPSWANVDLHVEQLRPGPTRSLALRRASGDLVMTLDCDDMLLDIVSLIEVLASRPEVGWVAASTVDLVTTGLMRARRPPWDEGPLPAGAVLDYWVNNDAFPFQGSGAFIARTDLVRAVGGWPNVMYADDALLAVAVSETAAGWFDPGPVHVYRRHDQQVTATADWAATREARIAETRAMFLAGRPGVTAA